MISARARRRKRNGPRHHGHEERSVALIEALAARLRVPADYRELAVIVARYHGIVHRAFELKPRTVLEFIERADAVRRPERFGQVLLACEADARGRLGLEDKPYPQREYLIAARIAAAAVKPSAEELAAPRPENRRAAAPAPARDHHRAARTVRTLPRLTTAQSKRVPQILHSKRRERCIHAAHPSHGLEALTHLARQ